MKADKKNTVRKRTKYDNDLKAKYDKQDKQNDLMKTIILIC